MPKKDRRSELTRSLVGYLEDIKPFHTKLREVNTQLIFEEEAHLAFEDEEPIIDIHMQGAWDGSSIGGSQWSFISDGSPANSKLRIPAISFPRFEDSIKLNSSNLMPIDLPIDNVDIEPVTFANGEIPEEMHLVYNLIVKFTNPPENYGLSPFAPFDVFYDGNLLINGTHYDLLVPGLMRIKNLTKSFSLTANFEPYFTLFKQTQLRNSNARLVDQPYARAIILRHMGTNELKRVQLQVKAGTGRYPVPFHHGLKVKINNVAKIFGQDFIVGKDRSYIQFLKDRHPSFADTLDIQILKSDRLFISLTDPLDHKDNAPKDMIIFTISDTHSFRYKDLTITYPSESFQKPKLRDLFITQAATDGMKWELTAVSDWQMRVRLLNPGPSQFPVDRIATVGEKFVDAYLSFILDHNWIDYNWESDSDTYEDHENQEFRVYPIDKSDYLVNPALLAPHGTVNHPLFFDMRMQPSVGVLKITKDPNALGDQFVYTFVLDKEPAAGTWVQVLTEQNTHTLNHTNLSFVEDLRFSGYWQPQETVDYKPASQGIGDALFIAGWDEKPFDIAPHDQSSYYTSITDGTSYDLLYIFQTQSNQIETYSYVRLHPGARRYLENESVNILFVNHQVTAPITSIELFERDLITKIEPASVKIEPQRLIITLTTPRSFVMTINT